MSRRLLLVLALAGLWMTALVGRLVYLQVVRHDLYSARADGQHTEQEELSSPRGTIYDRQGRVLAVSVPADTVGVNLVEVRRNRSAREVARRLAEPLGMPAAEIAARLASDKNYVHLQRKVDPPRAHRVRGLELPGVELREESKRYYPMRSLAGQILGHVGFDDTGKAGLELAYEKDLAGRKVFRKRLQNARFARAATPEMPIIEAVPGRNLHLTLDAALQHVVEEELARAVEEHHARAASAVFLDPRDGSILAMATVPTFDPHGLGEMTRDSYRELHRNRGIQDLYEPGSTFKMVTVSAALEANRVDPSDVFDCQMGSITIGGQRTRDHKPFGLLTVREVMAKSSNVGAIKIGLQTGKEDLYRTIRAFGFGERTGVDLAYEEPGILRPVESWRPLETANISFGQGVSVTVLQLASAFGAVANGGLLWRPRLVAALEETHPEGGAQWEARPPVPRRRVLSPSTAREVERMLEAVVEEGTGKAAQVPGYRVAGKTGTAQVPEPGYGYSRGLHHANFVGFLPARDPVLVGAVVVFEPRVRYHGGEAAAPVFGRIARRAMFYLGQPRSPVDPEPAPTPDAAPGPVPSPRPTPSPERIAGHVASPEEVDS